MKRFDVLTIGLQVIDLMIPGMDGHILDREMTLLDHAELTLGGDALMSMGLPIRLRGDYDSAVFELTAE